MYGQKFAIGEVVGVALNSLTGPKTQAMFRVLGRYLTSGTAPIYRIQSLWDRAERMVSETELLPRPSRMISAAPGVSKVVPIRSRVLPFRRLGRP